MFLSPEELAELTDRPQPKRQIAWLTEHGWVFDIGAKGLPKVDIDYYKARMSGKPQARQQQPRWDKV